jgi:hypothetical protein
MRRRTRNLYIMLGVLALLAAGALAEQVRERRFGTRYFMPDAGNSVQQIERECPGCAPLKLIKRQGRWELVEPYVAPADPEAVARLLAAANAPVRHYYATAELPDAQTGFDAPSLRLKLGETLLEFGAAAPGKDRYVRSGERVALVQDRFSASASAPPEQFVDRRPLAGRKPIAGTSLGQPMAPEHLAALGELVADEVLPAPKVMRAHLIRVTFEDGKEAPLMFELRGDEGMLLLERGKPYMFRLDTDTALAIGFNPNG